ncbi:polysaccharide biosynthesis protein [Bacillus sp. 1NLA3E]|uniref:polysaccharide biosynthesis protein n=1 Tax=Bacillus sp. 1NLA3E TaxID=666686 RepID=UPI000247E5E0|nr:polysaccharide biosynthesis protein [Bacillus sp. 1NLA3E]AGK52232.1 virulence factor MVIN family protein [Bacillus sp. 1NLA3E]
MNTIFRGTLLLILASFISECVEFVVNMALAKELGERGMGLYMTILPTIFLIFLLSSYELPISISKFIAEKETKFHRSMLQHAIRLVIISTSVLLLAAMLILPFISVFDVYDPRIRWLVIILIPIVSFSSIAKGFFMGMHQMGKIAISNFLRKILQLVLLVSVFHLFEFEINTALLIALCTLVGSELVVFLYLFHMFIIQFRQLKHQSHQQISGRKVRQSLMAVSIPTTALRLFNALSNAIEPFLIKAALVHSGLTATGATEQFGLLAGVAMTIGFFPAFIAHSLLIVLIPTVSKAYADHDFGKLQRLLQQVMSVTFLYGTVAVTVFYIFAKPLTNLFFHSDSAAWYLQMLWPYFLFHFFVIPMQAYLIGLGLVKDAFIHTVWSTIFSFSLMYFLGSTYQFHMGGIIIGMNGGILLLTLMHYLTICKKIGISFTLQNSIKRHYEVRDRRF